MSNLRDRPPKETDQENTEEAYQLLSKLKEILATEPTFDEQYGALHDIPNETLYKFLEENETRDAAFLAIVCSEILRRRIK